jgi:chitin disaccharide deacetylase
MAHGAAFPHAVSLAKGHPSLDIGVHLQIVQGPYPATIPELVWQLALSRWNVPLEFRRQVETVLSAGLRPTHLDTHKHTHLLPPVLDAVLEVGEEFKIPFVRRPFDLPFTGRPLPLPQRLAAQGMKLAKPRMDRLLRSANLRCTDHFAGFALTGDYTAMDLVHLIEALPAGSTEFMCHPGQHGPQLEAASTRLKRSRAQELAALTDPRVRDALVRCGVHLCGYRDLIGQVNPELGAT